MTTWQKVALASFLLLLLSSCVAGTPASNNAMNDSWIWQLILGLWHGLIAFFTLLVEVARALFPDVSLPNWRMYERNDTTFVYDIGFFLGIGSHLGFWWGRPWTYWRARRRRL